MPNPTPPDVLDRMIARLEEANARSCREPLRAQETPSGSGHDKRHPTPSQPAASNRQPPSWVKPLFVSVILLLIAAPVTITSFTWESSYVDAVKLTFARWAHASVLQNQPEMPAQAGAVPSASTQPEIEQRLEKMADDLTSLKQRVEQLKTSQDQVSEFGAETAAQLKVDRKQMMSDNANVADQLKATQERLNAAQEQLKANQEQLKATQAQLAEVVLSKSASSTRKSFRRKRGLPLSLSPRARSSVR